MMKREKIIRLLSDYPQISYRDVAKQVGCHTSYVYGVERSWLEDNPMEEQQPDMFVRVEQTEVSPVVLPERIEPALTGGSNDYWKARVERPTSGGEPYTAECNDIIEALRMESDVANVFKAAWRVAALRQGHGKPGQDSTTYDGEKIVFFGQRIIAREQGK